MPRSASNFAVSPAGCADYRALASRRQALQVGALSALGLNLADWYRQQAHAADGATSAYSAATGSQGSLVAKTQSVIQIHLGGGFPQQESFDPKPEAPVEYRGSFDVIKTRAGETLSENFPKVAEIMDKVTLLRSVVGRIPDHQQATYHLFTGYTPTAVIDYPQMGSIVSHELGGRGQLPPYIAIPNKNAYAGGTGFLSSTYGPFELNADPGQAGYRVKDFALPDGVSTDRYERRRRARQIVEGNLRRREIDPATLDTLDEFQQRAYTLLTSEETQAAFTLAGESEATLQLYGQKVTGLKGPDNRYHPKGLAERLIVARRLVEAGARFITINYGDWDCHVDVRKTCLDYMPALDHGIAGLIRDLDQRGMLESTLVWVTTEFGRTPKVNSSSGRDHWARCYSMLMAGGGFTPGLIYGASDSTAAEPAREALPLEDLLYTLYRQLGIDADKELVAFGTRPIEIVLGGKFVPGLVS